MDMNSNENSANCVQEKRKYRELPVRVILVVVLLLVGALELRMAYFEPAEDSLAYAEKNGVLSYQLGETLTFYDTATAAPYCRSGFSLNEGTHTWTEGNFAKMYFQLEGEHEDLALDFSYTMVYGSSQRVIVYANGYETANLTVTEPGSQTVRIPKEYVADDSLELEFWLPDAVSPAVNEGSADTRALALGMSELCIERESDGQE